MSWYQVVKPCVVGKLHYAKPTTQPIEVDDETAAPLVEAGALEPYGPSRVAGKTGDVIDSFIGEIAAEIVEPEDDEPEDDEPTPRTRRTRKPRED
jgi:hypothetical protein